MNDEKTVIEHYLTDDGSDFVPLSILIAVREDVEKPKPAELQEE